ncbi:MAG TPA: M56 family metallopeptidase [Mycobacteriales bacterium]|nr:M56 family metallopeptidase [Mycobacteriales bacterium]
MSSISSWSIWLLLVPGLGASVLLAVAAPWLVRSLSPELAARVLVSGSVTCAGCALVSLALLTMSGLGALSVAAHLGRWSSGAVAAAHPPPVWVGSAAGLLLVGLLAAVAPRVVSCGHALWHAERGARTAGPALVVLPDPIPFAYAVGGVTRGRVAVSTGLLALLDDAERAAVLAHEQAHLAGRHHLIRAATVLAARADPMLHRLPALVRLTTERAADERAARVCGDRLVVARALCRAALAARGHLALPAAAGFAHDAVGVRVQSLLVPVPRTRRWPVLGLVLVLAVTVVATVLAAHGVHSVFDHARDAAQIGHP